MRSIDNTADILFAYVRDILYEPGKAQLNLDKLDPGYRKLGQGLQYLAQCINEQRDLATALSKGNLSAPLPPPGNVLAAPLKALHATLKHLTWQTKEVAKGHYQHRLDFMGEFATAFNTMVEQLDSRQKALEREIENTNRKTIALEQSNSLLVALTQNVSQWLIVTDLKTHERLFVNATAQKAFQEDEQLRRQLDEWVAAQTQDGVWEQQEGAMELELAAGNRVLYFSVDGYPMNWAEHSAVAHVFSDISAEKERLIQLEKHAYKDNLTRVDNRYSGMQALRQWLEEKRQFCLCFADLDNLKYVNDNFGHTEGDRYIVRAAELLSGFSSDALVSRLGGDEFMILAPNCTRARAEKRMRVVRQGLEADYETGATPYMQSISFGVVEVKPGTTQSASELLGIADERMYAFKRTHKARQQSSG